MKNLWRMAALVAGGTLALTLSACGGGSEEPAGFPVSEEQATTVEASSAPVADSASSGKSFADGVLESEDMTIRITDVRKIAVGEPGNEYGDTPVLGFWYDITNKSDKEITPMNWIGTFQAVQDNDPNMVNELQVASHPDFSLLDTQTAQIKQGGTVSNAVAYELSDETTPVELTASTDFGFSEIGRQTFPVE